MLVAKEDVVKISADIIHDLKKMARNNGLNKSRLLLHKNREEMIHEMLIVYISSPPKKFKYNIPHSNTNTSKSYQVIEGEVILVIFDNKGGIYDYYLLSANSVEKYFMVRLNASAYHMMIPISNELVYIETLLGTSTGKVDAPWAPDEDDSLAAQKYIENLCSLMNI